MDYQLENEMETGVIQGLYRDHTSTDKQRSPRPFHPVRQSLMRMSPSARPGCTVDNVEP